MVERPRVAERDRGGDRIQTWRAIRLRLALTAAAGTAAAAVALSPLLAAGEMRGDEQFLAAVALSALVFPLLGVTRLIPWATALLAACVLAASEHGDVGYAAVALSAGMLLLVAECASAAADLRGLDAVERRLGRRLMARIAVQSAAGAALAALVLAAGSLGIRADLATLALGLASGVALLGLVTVAVTRR